MNVGDRFESQRAAEEAVKAYGRATNQMFSIAAESTNVRKTNALYETFHYSRLIMRCKHGGEYRAHRKEEEATVKSLTTTAILYYII